MGGSLGEKVGEGAMADVHAWAPGQVVKLCKPGVRWRSGWHEARMTRAAFAAGLPAPQVLGEVTLDGRFGMVLRRLEGPTLKQLSKSGAMTSEAVGAVLANLALAVHRTPPPPEALGLGDWMEAGLRLAGGALAEQIGGVLGLIERLPPGDGLCHGDLHSGNVIMTPEGPVIIDWIAMVRAPAAYDLAVLHVLLSDLAPAVAVDPQRLRAVNAAAQAAYARLAGLSPAALKAAVAPCLPIVRASALLGGAVPTRRDWLIERVVAAVRSAQPAP